MVIVRNLTKDLKRFNRALLRCDARDPDGRGDRATGYRPGRPLMAPYPFGPPDDAGACERGVAMPRGWSGSSGASVKRFGGVGVPNGVTEAGRAP